MRRCLASRVPRSRRTRRCWRAAPQRLPEGVDTTTRDRILVQVNSVSGGYFDTIGIPLLRGRDFTRADTNGAPLVVIVNETMAERFWPNQDAIGKRFKFFGDAGFTTIIGVARNSKYNGVAEEPIPFIYQPLLQNYTPQATLLARAETHAAGLATAVRREVREIDPTLHSSTSGRWKIRFDSLAPLRTNVVIMAAFGVLALALASIGLYGVASYNVTQRTREIGVRMALGARRANVLRLIPCTRSSSSPSAWSRDSSRRRRSCRWCPRRFSRTSAHAIR